MTSNIIALSIIGKNNSLENNVTYIEIKKFCFELAVNTRISFLRQINSCADNDIGGSCC